MNQMYDQIMVEVLPRHEKPDFITLFYVVMIQERPVVVHFTNRLHGDELLMLCESVEAAHGFRRWLKSLYDATHDEAQELAEQLQNQLDLGDAAKGFALLTPEGDEGPMIFMVNGIEVGRCDHDSAGWQGMRDQKDLFLNTARALKQRVLLVDMGQQAGVIE